MFESEFINPGVFNGKIIMNAMGLASITSRERIKEKRTEFRTKARGSLSSKDLAEEKSPGKTLCAPFGVCESQTDFY